MSDPSKNAMVGQHKIGIVILAGGEARRLGGVDKPLLLLAGRTILARQIKGLQTQKPAYGSDAESIETNHSIALNANGNAARYAEFELPILADRAPKHLGPLAGIHAGLIWAQGCGFESLLTVPADCPFLPDNLLHRLTEAQCLTKKAVICAASGVRDHFVTALWRLSCLRQVEAALAAEESRVETVLNTLGYGKAQWPCLPFDPFFNINTREDFREAEQIIRVMDN